MKKTLSTILIGAFSIGLATASLAATDVAKATYTAAKEGAAADYKTARAQCDSVTGNPKDVCKQEAEAVRVRTEAEAEAQYKHTPAALKAARIAIASAEYDVAKTKCGSRTGNDKDVCIKEAQAAQVAAKADATADKKVVAARVDARDEKVAANFKVAIEKCDALAGPSKDSCIAAAKAQFGK